MPVLHSRLAPYLTGPVGNKISRLHPQRELPDVRRLPAPLELESAAECTRLERESFGALHQMLAGLAEEEREEAWAEIESALRQFEGLDGFVGPCELLVGAGAN